MAQKVLALTKEHTITYCVAPPEKRGRGRCNHIDHQRDDETIDEFVSRVSIKEDYAEEAVPDNRITKDEVASLKERLNEIAGCELTEENLNDVINSLPPEKQREMIQIGFANAQYFRNTLDDKEVDEDEIDKLSIKSNMYNYGLGHNQKQLNAAFEEVGTIVTEE